MARLCNPLRFHLLAPVVHARLLSYRQPTHLLLLARQKGWRRSYALEANQHLAYGVCTGNCALPGNFTACASNAVVSRNAAKAGKYAAELSSSPGC